jgi:integrase
MSTPQVLTAAGAILAVGQWDDLPPIKRRDLISALNTVARLQGMPPDAVMLTPAGLRPGLLSLSAAAAGVGVGRMRNLLSHLRFVLRRLGCIDRADMPLLPAWDSLLAPLDARQRASVIALARFCSARDILPEAVDACLMLAFRDWLERRTLTPNPTKLAGNTRGAWNRFTTRIPGWPARKIERSGDTHQFILPLDRFTPAFQQDVAAFEARLQRSILNDPFDDDLDDAGQDNAADPDGDDAMPPARPRKPLRPSSAAGRAAHARWAASALVATGMPVEQITSLADLVRPLANAKAILTYIRDQGTKGRSSQGSHIGPVLRIIAKYEAHLPVADVQRISRWASAVALRYGGMTEKNQRAIATALMPERDARLLGLPKALMAAAEQLLPQSPRKAATIALRAVAIAFLTRVPLRLANVTGLRLDRHIQRNDPRRPDIHAIHIPPEESKTDIPITMPIPAALNRVLQLWITRYRPILAVPGNPYLFPGAGKGDRPMTPQGFRDAIRSVTHEIVGAKLSPHQFRHLAGNRYLKAYPGEYETVRQLLGHRSLATTVKHYAGTDVEGSAARFDALITTPARAKKAGKARKGRKPPHKTDGGGKGGR